MKIQEAHTQEREKETASLLIGFVRLRGALNGRCRHVTPVTWVLACKAKTSRLCVTEEQRGARPNRIAMMLKKAGAPHRRQPHKLCCSACRAAAAVFSEQLTPTQCQSVSCRMADRSRCGPRSSLTTSLARISSNVRASLTSRLLNMTTLTLTAAAALCSQAP